MAAFLLAGSTWITRAAQVTYDFSTDPTAIAGIQIGGSNDQPWQQAGGNPGGFLALTYPVDYNNLTVIFPDLDPGMVVTAFTLECDLRVGNSEGTRGADGFSISFARAGDPVLTLWSDPNYGPGRGMRGDLASDPTATALENAALSESGTMTGVAISFDTWQGNTLPEGADLEGLIVAVDNKRVLGQALPTRHGACEDATSLQTGPRDLNFWGAGGDIYSADSWKSLCWAHLFVQMDESGKLTVKWKGTTLLDNFQTAYFPTPGRLVLAGRTGGENEHTHVDNIKLTTTAVVGESEPPTTPANLRATIIGARRIALAWDPAEDRPDPRVRVAYELEKDGSMIGGILTSTNYEDRASLKPSSSHTYRVRAVDLNQNKSGWASVTVQTVAEVPVSGWFIGQVYDGLSGAAWSDLTTAITDPKYPNNPDRDGPYFNGLSFGAPAFGNTFGDNLLVRFAGTLTPPETGQYRFFVRSDDASAFYLNTSGTAIPDPNTASPNAEEHGCCSGFEEPGTADNGDGTFPTSEPVALTAGQKYGFLFIVKEGGGGDWGQVAWRKEGDTTPALQLPPISGAFIESAAKLSDPVGASVTITTQPQDATVIANEPVSISVAATTVSPWTTVVVYQWYQDGKPVLNANSATLNIPVAATSHSGKYKVLISVPGAEATSSEATLTVSPDTKLPTVVGVHGSDSFTSATIKFSEPVTDPSAVTAANYQASGGLTISALTRVDAYTVRLTTSTQTVGAEYTLTLNNIKDNAGNSIAANTTATLYAFIGGNGIAHRYWNNVSGNTIDSLTGDSRFPNNPTFSTIEPLFEYGPNGSNESGSDYGNMLFGWLNPTETGQYIFFTSADDPSNLYLSTDDNPANKKLIAQEQGWSDARQWKATGSGDVTTKRSDQFTSTEWPTGNTITLQAGKSYYIEVLHTEGGGGDNVGVAWKTPSGSEPNNGDPPISKDFVKAYIDPAAGAPVISKQPQNTVVRPGAATSLSVEVSLGERPFSYQWRKASINIPDANSAALSIPKAGANDAGSYSVVVSNPAGSSLSSSAGLILEGTFLIEAEDFNYDSGKSNPQKGVAGKDVNVMPYTGGAYDGLGAVVNVDYGSNDGDDSDLYRKGEQPNKDMDAVLGNQLSAFRGAWDVNVNFKLGWADSGDWGNYTRTFPSGNYQVLAALSYDSRDADLLKGKLDLVTSPVNTTAQTVQALGKFAAPGSGGWGRNELVPMADDAGAPKVITLGGEQTVRFTMDSGDFDYLLFVPSEAVLGPAFTSIKLNADGTITVEWTGGGTLQAAPTVAGPWQDVTGATSPYKFAPTEKVLFGRIRK